MIIQTYGELVNIHECLLLAKKKKKRGGSW